MVFEVVESLFAPELRPKTVQRQAAQEKLFSKSMFLGDLAISRLIDKVTANEMVMRLAPMWMNAVLVAGPNVRYTVRTATSGSKRLRSGHSSNGLHYTWILSPVVEVSRH